MLAAQVTDVVFVQLLSSVLFGLTVAQPLLQLRRPRPPFREFIRSSGLATCLGAILGIFIVTDIWWISGTWWITRSGRIDWLPVLALALLSPHRGAAVGGVEMDWLPVLALALLWPVLGVFPWRSEASWIDRLGRAAGWGWIVASMSAIAVVYRT
jgi:hypothetical protein